MLDHPNSPTHLDGKYNSHSKSTPPLFACCVGGIFKNRTLLNELKFDTLALITVSNTRFSIFQML
jgi:hypothetical protein